MLKESVTFNTYDLCWDSFYSLVFELVINNVEFSICGSVWRRTDSHVSDMLITSIAEMNVNNICGPILRAKPIVE